MGGGGRARPNWHAPRAAWEDATRRTPMAEGKQFKRLTAHRKFEIYLQTRPAGAPVGEILRRHGLTLEDLRRIEETVQGAAVEALKIRSGHWKKSAVTPEGHETLRRRY